MGRGQQGRHSAHPHSISETLRRARQCPLLRHERRDVHAAASALSRPAGPARSGAPCRQPECCARWRGELPARGEMIRAPGRRGGGLGGAFCDGIRGCLHLAAQASARGQNGSPDEVQRQAGRAPGERPALRALQAAEKRAPPLPAALARVATAVGGRSSDWDGGQVEPSHRGALQRSCLQLLWTPPPFHGQFIPPPPFAQSARSMPSFLPPERTPESGRNHDPRGERRSFWAPCAALEERARCNAGPGVRLGQGPGVSSALAGTLAPLLEGSPAGRPPWLREEVQMRCPEHLWMQGMCPHFPDNRRARRIPPPPAAAAANCGQLGKGRPDFAPRV